MYVYMNIYMYISKCCTTGTSKSLILAICFQSHFSKIFHFALFWFFTFAFYFCYLSLSLAFVTIWIAQIVNSISQISCSHWWHLRRRFVVAHVDIHHYVDVVGISGHQDHRRQCLRFHDGRLFGLCSGAGISLLYIWQPAHWRGEYEGRKNGNKLEMKNICPVNVINHKYQENLQLCY